MMFWGDIALEHPELISDLPGDALPLLWGYEADHPFADQAGALAATGLEFYVCPGTSSWLSFAGRWSNALANLAAAASAGAEQRRARLPDHGLGRSRASAAARGQPAAAAGRRLLRLERGSGALTRERCPWPSCSIAGPLPDSAPAPAMLALGDAHLGTGRALKNSTVPFHLLDGRRRSVDSTRARSPRPRRSGGDLRSRRGAGGRASLPPPATRTAI